MAAKEKTGNAFVETIKTIFWALLIAGVFRTLFFQPFSIPSVVDHSFSFAVFSAGQPSPENSGSVSCFISWQKTSSRRRGTSRHVCRRSVIRGR